MSATVRSGPRNQGPARRDSRMSRFFSKGGAGLGVAAGRRRACGQKTGRRKLGCSVVLPHSAHMSTGARATGSSGQKGKRPWRAAR